MQIITFKQFVGFITGIILMSILVIGCGEYADDRGVGDAPVSDQLESPRTVIAMPDQFPNLAVYCDGTTAIYVTTRTNPGTVVVENSTNCRAE